MASFDNSLRSPRTSKIIFHVDANAFFVSCETAREKQWKNYPAVVCKRAGHAIVLAANYPARSYGIKAAMPLFKARELFPQLHIFEPNMRLYTELSHQLFAYLTANGTSHLEVGSIDEGYLDVTSKITNSKMIMQLAQRLQDGINRTLHLPVSIGISFTKYFAKIASNLQKPLGIKIISQRNYRQILWNLPVKIAPGIGKKTQLILTNLNIRRISDFVNYKSSLLLERYLGIRYYQLKNAFQGKSSDYVDRNWNFYKSAGHEVTFESTGIHYDVLVDTLRELTRATVYRLQSHSLLGTVVGASLKTNQFQSFRKQVTLPKPTNDCDVILPYVLMLFEQLYNDHSDVRSLGMSIGKLKYRYFIFNQLDMFVPEPEMSKKVRFFDFKSHPKIITGTDLLAIKKRDKLKKFIDQKGDFKLKKKSD